MVVDSMKVIGFTEEEVDSVYKILAAILHLVRAPSWGFCVLSPQRGPGEIRCIWCRVVRLVATTECS